VRRSEACYSWWVDMTRGLQKGVTLNVASARCAFYGFCEVVFRKRIGQLVVDRKGALLSLPERTELT